MKPYTEPGCDPSCSPEFQNALIEIAGLNPFGQPILRCVDGRTAQKWEAGEWHLRYLQEEQDIPVGYEYQTEDGPTFVKYLHEVPEGSIPVAKVKRVEYGQQFHFIERWRDPEFLKATGRFSTVIDPGETVTFFECRGCGAFVPTDPKTHNLDIERKCLRCGSNRVSPRDIKELGDGRLLPDLPSEGYYDYYAKLERKDGSYHPADGEALLVIRAMWNYEHFYSLQERNEHMKRDARPRFRPRPGTRVSSVI